MTELQSSGTLNRQKQNMVTNGKTDKVRDTQTDNSYSHTTRAVIFPKHVYFEATSHLDGTSQIQTLSFANYHLKLICASQVGV